MDTLKRFSLYRRLLAAMRICSVLLMALFAMAPVEGGDLSCTQPMYRRIVLCRGKRRKKPKPNSASYSRYSSDLQDGVTIDSQQAGCRDASQRHGRAIMSELQFADHAVSGTKLERRGLTAMLAAAAAGAFDTLYFFSLSRLARESVITMPLLKRLVYSYGIRVISVSEGVDTARPGWETHATILALQHERYVQELAANVLRGQSANVKGANSNGDYCFGYTTQPIPGSENTRRGRHARPRMQYLIEPTAAEWVRRIFHWFAVERRSVSWITRQLNQQHAPKDHRARTANWRHQYVIRLLSNEKYVGRWHWGQKRNVRDPETGIVHQEERTPDETQQWVRYLPELRLIDDETFMAAQRRLQENASRYAKRRTEEGKFCEGESGSAAPSTTNLLAQLIVCGECGRRFYVGGSDGKYLFCPGHQEGVCGCKTKLNRQLAEQLILQEIGQQILDNPAWLAAVQAAVQKSWTERQQTLPNAITDTERALAEADRKIGRLVDVVENSAEPDPDIQQRLRERRAERRDCEDRLAALRVQASDLPQGPTASWVETKLQSLRDSLTGSTPAAGHALRELVGQIVVREVRRPGRERHYLRGTLYVGLAQACQACNVTVAVDVVNTAAHDRQIVIDFVREDPSAGKARRAFELYQEGWMCAEIAKELGVARNFITKLLRREFAARGLSMPDGRSRRGTLAKKHLIAPQYQAIADAVMQMFDGGMLLHEIAQRLCCNHATVTAAVRYWHESRGLPVPDGRARRRTLKVKSSPKGTKKDVMGVQVREEPTDIRDREQSEP